MARPDARLLELTAVLTEAGLDWLALELLEEVRDGHPVEERPEDLENARREVRVGQGHERSKDLPRFLPPNAEEFRGAEQVAWATAYVLARLADAAEMLDASLDQLNAIAAPSDAKVQSEAAVERRLFQIALQIGEDGPILHELDLARVRMDFVRLKEALDEWSRGSQS